MLTIGPSFTKESVRGKSDSQMQGDQYISSALDINSTIRAYQVHPRKSYEYIALLRID